MTEYTVPELLAMPDAELRRLPLNPLLTWALYAPTHPDSFKLAERCNRLLCNSRPVTPLTDGERRALAGFPPIDTGCVHIVAEALRAPQSPAGSGDLAAPGESVTDPNGPVLLSGGGGTQSSD